jgi:hypothetical protein
MFFHAGPTAVDDDRHPPTQGGEMERPTLLILQSQLWKRGVPCCADAHERQREERK